MAEDKKQGSNGLATALPVTVVLTILATLFFKPSLPYQDERPAAPSLSPFHAPPQDIDARLWQDPFAAVAGAGESPVTEKIDLVVNLSGLPATKPATHPCSMPDKIFSDFTEDKGDKVTVLVIPIPGGPYQEDAEQRMRYRYAVLSGLANQNLVPQDEVHIGYFQPEVQEKTASDMNNLLQAEAHSDRLKPEPGCQQDLDLQKKIPFEWWSPPKDVNNYKKVLLLWLDASNLEERPAHKIQKLLREVSQAGKSKVEDIQFDYAVIGPNRSTLLLEMMQELSAETKSPTLADNDAEPDANPETVNGVNIVYFSAGATASDQKLLHAIGNTEDKTVSEYLQRQGLILYRTTATDSDMMQALVQELNWRRIEKNDHVVILSEWDTFYGRVMPDAFKESWGNEGNGNKGKSIVHVYSYMRGLDGKLPDKGDKGNKAGEKNSGGQDKSAADALIEFPEGQNQKDYLRRQAEAIRELDRHLKQTGNMKGVAAFGVLGSDVHDKLMILEALRQYFPHKLFFTTDLDAIYSHPAKWKQTHNLLVASAFDLKLRDKLQDKIPPFRNSYQTAFFLAAQLALKEGKGLADRLDLDSPRLFEIGRGRPVALPTLKERSEGSNPDCSWKQWLSCNAVQPPISAPYRLPWQLGKVVAVAVMAAILLSLVSWQIRKEMGLFFQFSRAHPYAMMGAGVILVLTYSLTLSWWNGYSLQTDAEPFYWLEGVSIWPSQLMRLSIILFAIVFFLWGKRRIRKMQNDLQAHSGQQKFALPKAHYPNRLGQLEVLFVGSWQGDEDSKAKVFPEALWKKYRGYCRKKTFGITASWLRVLLHWLAFFMALILLFTMLRDTPNMPARGEVASAVNKYVLILAVIATQLLIIWVVDNARLCERFIFHLSEKPSQWNKNARDWAIREHKIAPECVGEWLDIQLVARMTKTLQPLIWGPVICIGLLILARNPVIDDWDMPVALILVYIAMLLYAISTEVFLQLGAKNVRTKTIEFLSRKIRERRNLKAPDEASIKRLETEIERIRSLRQGAFGPWYEWPLLQSFGGVGTLIVALEYLVEGWNNGSF